MLKKLPAICLAVSIGFAPIILATANAADMPAMSSPATHQPIRLPPQSAKPKAKAAKALKVSTVTPKTSPKFKLRQMAGPGHPQIQ